MIMSDDIKTLLENEGMNLYVVKYNYDNECDITLTSGDFDELIQLAKENNIKSIFISFDFLDEDDYFITDDDRNNEVTEYQNGYDGFKKLYDEYNRYFNIKQKEHNKKLEAYDFNQPYVTNAFIVLNGLQVGIVEYYDWADELPEKNPILHDIDNYYTELKEEYERQQAEFKSKKHDKVLQMIYEHISASTDWHKCTNQQLRRSYCVQLAQDYNRKFGTEINYWDIADRFELMWKDYKLGK